MVPHKLPKLPDSATDLHLLGSHLSRHGILARKNTIKKHHSPHLRHQSRTHLAHTPNGNNNNSINLSSGSASSRYNSSRFNSSRFTSTKSSSRTVRDNDEGGDDYDEDDYAEEEDEDEEEGDDDADSNMKHSFHPISSRREGKSTKPSAKELEQRASRLLSNNVGVGSDMDLQFSLENDGMNEAGDGGDGGGAGSVGGGSSTNRFSGRTESGNNPKVRRKA